ncbi:hypothetical protein [Thauera humireducens]|uniref:hypothetical protein n=1 Tax=Thauera humireducens TaxID=1134435 RepID=UPI00311F1CC2
MDPRVQRRVRLLQRQVLGFDDAQPLLLSSEEHHDSLPALEDSNYMTLLRPACREVMSLPEGEAFEWCSSARWTRKSPLVAGYLFDTA